jgi:hypothetical protein
MGPVAVITAHALQKSPMPDSLIILRKPATPQFQELSGDRRRDTCRQYPSSPGENAQMDLVVHNKGSDEVSSDGRAVLHTVSSAVGNCFTTALIRVPEALILPISSVSKKGGHR